MSKVAGEGRLRFDGQDTAVEYNFEAFQQGGKTAGYGRLAGDFESLDQAFNRGTAELVLNDGQVLQIVLRDAHEVTGSRFDVVAQGPEMAAASAP